MPRDNDKNNDSSRGRRDRPSGGKGRSGAARGPEKKFAKRGFAGKYRIYDLPEFLELQRWYLGRTLARADVEYLSVLPSAPVDVLVGLWSISEMPFALRDRIKALAPRYFLLAYQQEFYGLDNVEYFERWRSDQDYAWHDIEIPHIKGDRYLFGARK